MHKTYAQNCINSTKMPLLVKMLQTMRNNNAMFVHKFYKKGIDKPCISVYNYAHNKRARCTEFQRRNYHEKDYCYADGSDAGYDRYRRIYRL